MPKLPASLAEVSTKSEPYPEGAYEAKITDVEVGKSKSKLDMVTVTFEVKHPETGKKREVKEYCVFETKEHGENEGGMRRFKRIVVAAVGENRANAEDFDTDEIEGEMVTVILKHEEYEDKDSGDEEVTNRIKKVLPLK